MSIRSKATAVIMTGLLAASAAVPSIAMALDNNEPSVDGPTGTGVTDITVIRADTNEHGGTDEPEFIPNPNFDPTKPEGPNNLRRIPNPAYNPDNDGDGYGDNLAFSVPSAINFVSDADGNLTGPATSVCHIENLSDFAIHGSSFKTAAAENWTIVDKDAEDVQESNAIDFQFGPEANILDAYDFLEKTPLDNPAEWNMAIATDEGVADRVEMVTSGKLHNVNIDIASVTKVAEIHTYVTPGVAIPTT